MTALPAGANIAFAQSPPGIWPPAAIPSGAASRRPRKRGPLPAAANAARWADPASNRCDSV